MAVSSINAPKRASRVRKVGIGLVLPLCGLYIAACGFFYFQQDKLTFPVPTQYPKTTPQDIGLSFEDLQIPVNGSEQIHAWWIPSASPTGRVVLVLHGNGVVIEQSFGADRAMFESTLLHQLGVNLLLFDYRGYGSSSPTPPSEQHFNEDAQAAYAYLTVQRHIPSRDVIVFGRSIGTGPATELATHHPDAAGLILMSPFTRLSDAGKALWFLRPLPLSLLVRNPFDNLSKIEAVHVPVLIIVGSEDRIAPPAMAQALLQKANQPKHLYVQPGAGHNHLVDIGGKSLEEQISAFVQSLP
jgi:pimeloyl-ACP methyl ester carboxylesterase